MEKEKPDRPSLDKDERRRELPDESRYLPQALENSSELIAMADREGNFIFANLSFLRTLGYSAEEAMGMHFRMVISPNNPPALLHEFAAKMFEPSGWKGECLVRRRNGTDFLVSLGVGPVKDANGHVVGSFGIAQDITERVQKEQALREAHEKLNVALAEAEQLAQEAARLSELVDILQSCQTLDEAYKVIQSTLQTTLLCRSGALCITSPSRNVVETAVSWGDAVGTDKTFRPDDCWALRRGKVHKVENADSPVRCAHVSTGSPGGYLCVPLAAQGETLGVLYLECSPPSAIPSSGLPGESNGSAGSTGGCRGRTHFSGHWQPQAPPSASRTVYS